MVDCMRRWGRGGRGHRAVAAVQGQVLRRREAGRSTGLKELALCGWSVRVGMDRRGG